MARWAPGADLHRTIVSGPLCPFSAHLIGSRDGTVSRYADSHACVKCTAALTEGRLDLDAARIHPIWRRRFLEFWSLVEIDEPDTCWLWHGARHHRTGAPIYAIGRHWTSARQWGARRAAAWLSWGDIGRLPLVSLCGNPDCVNPLHLRIKGVPHYFHGALLGTIDLTAQAGQLGHHTQQFLEASARDPIALARLQNINAEWINDRLADDDGDEEYEEDSQAVLNAGAS